MICNEHSSFLYGSMILFIVLITIILTQFKLSSSDDTFQKWRNVFVEEKDTVLLSYLGKYHNIKKLSSNAFKDDYYSTISKTAQNSCQIIKRFAGRWFSECGFEDGEKFICMDGLYLSLIHI